MNIHIIQNICKRKLINVQYILNIKKQYLNYSLTIINNIDIIFIDNSNSYRGGATVENIKKLFVEKKEGYNVEAKQLLRDLRENLNIFGLKKVRILNHYQIGNILKEDYERAVNTIFSEPNVDMVYEETFPINESDYFFRVEYLPGQYDQRADSAIQCLEILTGKNGYKTTTSKIVVLEGNINKEDLEKIKNYYINPVESREVPLDMITLDPKWDEPQEVEIVDGFIEKSPEDLAALREKIASAMDVEDLKY